MNADVLPRSSASIPMSFTLGCALFLLPAAASLAGAQAAPSSGAAEPLRLLGLSVAASGGPRDTLGLLVATVVRNGPADLAGITPGSRVLAVNGQAVRLNPNDIGRPRAADSVLQRFDEAVRATSGNSDVTLRVVGGGRTRTVALATAERRIMSTDALLQVPPPAAATGVTPAPMSNEPPAAAPRSLDGLIDALLAVQLDLRRIARDSQPRAVTDSLTDLEHDVALLRARVRRVQSARGAAGTQERNMPSNAVDVTSPTASPPAAPATAPMAAPLPQPAAPAVVTAPMTPSALTSAAPSAAKLSLAGLELARVSGDLAVFLGSQADSALLVQSASEAWEPLRAGDVVLKVDGAAPELSRLRDTLASERPVTLVVLRRGRTFSVALSGNRQL